MLQTSHTKKILTNILIIFKTTAKASLIYVNYM